MTRWMLELECQGNHRATFKQYDKGRQAIPAVVPVQWVH